MKPSIILLALLLLGSVRTVGHAQTSEKNGSQIQSSADGKIHVIRGDALFGGYVFGTGEVDSYGWPLGSRLTEIPESGCRPTITVSGSLSLCDGDSLRLTVPSGYRSYRWSNGDTTRQIVVRLAGKYSVTTTDSTGCTGTSDTVKVTVVKIAPVFVSPGGPLTFCAGDSARLSAPEGFVVYLWSTGETARTIPLRESGKYWVQVWTANGCTAVSDTARATVYPAPPKPMITTQGATLVTTNAVGYQWYRDGTEVPGATTNSIVIAGPGEYTVRVINGNGCTALSDPVTVTALGVEDDIADLPLRLIPDGARGRYALEGELPGEVTMRIELVDVQGRTVMNESVLAHGAYRRKITLEDLPPGAYFLCVSAGASVRVWRIVVE